MNPDQGTRFGTWPDAVSRYMYETSVPEWVAALRVDTGLAWWDLGGANGLLRGAFPNLTTLDSDPAKEPDVVADLLAVPPEPAIPRGILRYVLHYLPDGYVHAMLAALPVDELVVVQFVNDPPAVKYAASRHEPRRYFRTGPTLYHLLTDGTGWDAAASWVGPTYTVTGDFYVNRLGGVPADYVPHDETIHAHHLTRSAPMNAATIEKG